jgi:hypothetical protein
MWDSDGVGIQRSAKRIPAGIPPRSRCQAQDTSGHAALCGLRGSGASEQSPLLLHCLPPRRYRAAAHRGMDQRQYNPPHAGEGRVPAYIKRWWLATYGERCFQCGWAVRRTADGRVPLTWDHVDGDCSNNRRDNLRLLCPNRHALTDTYGSLNKVSRRRRWGFRHQG